jgi:peptide/nickel transport system substrate-binding protein
VSPDGADADGADRDGESADGVSADGVGAGHQGRIAAFWAERRARWTLPLVIIVIIIIVATVDHLEAHRISQVDEPIVSDLVSTTGGTATVNLDRPWVGFNPGTPAGADSSTLTLLSSVLPSAFIVAPDLTPTLNANLLKSVEVTTTTPLTIQYVLNPKAVWSDGVPVTAADFIYAWKSQRGNGLDVNRQPDQVATTLGYRDVASVVGSKTGKTVTVVFSKPFTDWRMLFQGMVPAHIAEKVGWNHGFDTFNPAVVLSAGPFMVKSATPNRAAVLVRNPRWWGPKATLAKVVVQLTPSESTSTAALANGNQTVFQPMTFSTDTLTAVSSLPNTESTVKSSLSFLQLEFNTLSPITSQLAVRQAIAHLVDRPTLLADTFGTIDPSLQLSEDHLAVPDQSSYRASSAAAQYDTPSLASADRLLASAGYHKVGLTYQDVLGNPLIVRLAVESGDPALSQVATEVASQLQAAGISVVTIPVDGAAGLAAASAVDGYDLALVTRSASTYLTTTIGWYSENLGEPGTNGSSDWSNFADPNVDQLFAQAAGDLNPVTGDTAYAQIDDVLWDQMVALPLFQEPGFVANGVQMSNVLYNPSTDGLLWNLASWSTLVPKAPHTAG